MSEEMEGYVELTCPKCQGKVEISREDADAFFIDIGKAHVYIGGMEPSRAKCIHCGQEFEKKQRFDPFGNVVIAENSVIAIGNGAVAAGGIAIGGSLHGSLVVNGRRVK